LRETKVQNRRLNAAVGAGNEVLFFSEPREWRRWLDNHHAKAQELWVGFHKKSSGQPSITWPQAVDEALCFGWIDGIRKSIDDTRYRIRFTPRRAGSIWSKVNVGRARALSDLGRMAPAGLKAFGDRTEARTAVYLYEQRGVARLDSAYEKKLMADRQAWEFFLSKPPGYRKLAIRWVISAKQEQTRLRRLARLIEDSRSGQTIQPLTRKPK
jgi:uncharacterized protein YdeI (YjbR/CyaY-like superfamily)